METTKTQNNKEVKESKVEASKIYLEYLEEVKKLGGKLSLEQEILLEQTKVCSS